MAGGNGRKGDLNIHFNINLKIIHINIMQNENLKN